MDLSRLVNPTRDNASEFDPAVCLYKVYGKYAYAQGIHIKSSGTGICIGGGYSGKAYLKKGTLLGLNITYISKMWHIWNPETMDTFYDEIYPYAHRGLLKPLMGICIPTIIGVYSTAAGRITIAMEPPHHIGWREADPHISPQLKEAILDAYRKIHAQGVLHNDVELRHMLIGDDDKVTIIDFGIASCKARPEEFALEMRKVKFVLDYKGAKDLEYARMRRAEARHERNVERERLRHLAKSNEEGNQVESDELPSEEEIEHPPFALIHLMEWDSEVATEGRPDGPGWRGKRFEIPAHMQNGPFIGEPGFERLPLKPYNEVNFGECAREALKGKTFMNHDQWMEWCRYLSWLWSPPPLPEGLREVQLSGVLAEIMAAPSTDNPCVPCATPCPSVIPDSVLETKIPTPRQKRSRDDEENAEEEPARKKLELEYNMASFNSPTCRLVGLSDTDSTGLITTPELSIEFGAEGSKSQLREETEGVERTLLARDSSPSESETLQTTVSSSSLRSSRRPPTSSASLCSIILVDKDEKQKVWSVTKQMLEDIQGYLRVKAPPTTNLKGKRVREQSPDGYDASGSDTKVCTNSRRKRKSTDDGVASENSDSNKRRKSADLNEAAPSPPSFQPTTSKRC